MKHAPALPPRAFPWSARLESVGGPGQRPADERPHPASAKPPAAPHTKGDLITMSTATTPTPVEKTIVVRSAQGRTDGGFNAIGKPHGEYTDSPRGRMAAEQKAIGLARQTTPDDPYIAIFDLKLGKGPGKVIAAYDHKGRELVEAAREAAKAQARSRAAQRPTTTRAAKTTDNTPRPLKEVTLIPEKQVIEQYAERYPDANVAGHVKAIRAARKQQDREAIGQAMFEAHEAGLPITFLGDAFGVSAAAGRSRAMSYAKKHGKTFQSGDARPRAASGKDWTSHVKYDPAERYGAAWKALLAAKALADSAATADERRALRNQAAFEAMVAGISITALGSLFDTSAAQARSFAVAHAKANDLTLPSKAARVSAREGLVPAKAADDAPPAKRTPAKRTPAKAAKRTPAKKAATPRKRAPRKAATPKAAEAA